MGKKSTTLALASIVVVLLSTMAMGSASASSKDLSNSGNIINTHQNCVAGTSCNLSSKNVISREPTSTTPCPQESPTILLLRVNVQQKNLDVELTDVSGHAVSVNTEITITFTGTGVPPNLSTTIDPGNEAFDVVPFMPPTQPGTYTAQAHFRGVTLPNGDGILLPSDSSVESFTIT